MIPFPKAGFLGIVLGMHAERFNHGQRANLCDADLRGANLLRADLRGANLCDANLRGANLCDANLCGANLLRADLRGADLRGADLCDADLRRIIGQGSAQMVCLQVEPWLIVMTPDQMAIGCEQHAVADWWGFGDARIDRMDRQALAWWRTWKPVLQQIHAKAFGEADEQ